MKIWRTLILFHVNSQLIKIPVRSWERTNSAYSPGNLLDLSCHPSRASDVDSYFFVTILLWVPDQNLVGKPGWENKTDRNEKIIEYQQILPYTWQPLFLSSLPQGLIICHWSIRSHLLFLLMPMVFCYRLNYIFFLYRYFSPLIFSTGTPLPAGQTYSSLCSGGFVWVIPLLLYFCSHSISLFYEQ